MSKPEKESIDNDILIVKRISAGDKQAFQFLFETYFVPLCRFVRIYVREKGIAEEIVLDVLTSIWDKKEGLYIKLTLKAYLFQAARNKAINYIRDNERFVTVSDWSTLERFETDSSLEVKELEHLIREAICSLPDRCREIFEKSRTQHLSNKEIAEQLSVSVKNVEAQITKALKIIKFYLGDAYTYFW